MARTETAVVLQMMTPTMRVTIDVAETGKTPAELEPALEAAAIALVGSLPANALDLLDPNWKEDAKAAVEREAKREAKAAKAAAAKSKPP